MAERRKDSKNRVLRAGESQRKDGTYMYRYTDVTGKRVCVYARTLEDLRVKEQMIQKELNDGIDYAAGKATTIDLVERYVSLKQGARYSTKVLYDYILGILKNEDFGYRQIREIKQSDVQAWVIKLHQDGRSYGTIRGIRSVLRPAFKMAYNEDVIRRNPFDFNLSDVIPNDTKKRAALSEDTREAWMEFIRTDEVYQKYYDEFVVLLGTGLRVSEFCGLTRNDLDFENRRIRVEHQLCRQRDGTYYIGKRRAVYPYDGRGVPEFEEHDRQPSEGQGGADRGRVQRFPDVGQERKSKGSPAYRKRDPGSGETVSKTAPGQHAPSHFAPCIPPHLLHGTCRRWDRGKVAAVSDGARNDLHHAGHLHPHQLRVCRRADGAGHQQENVPRKGPCVAGTIHRIYTRLV